VFLHHSEKKWLKYCLARFGNQVLVGLVERLRTRSGAESIEGALIMLDEAAKLVPEHTFSARDLDVVRTAIGTIPDERARSLAMQTLTNLKAARAHD
jgi:hypothetical protein